MSDKKFNLQKYSQGQLDGAMRGLGSGLDEARELVDSSESSELNTESLTKGLSPEDLAQVLDVANLESWNRVMSKINEMPPEVRAALERTPDFQKWNDVTKRVNPNQTESLKMNNPNLQGSELAVSQNADIQALEDSVLSRANSLARAIEQQKSLSNQDRLRAAAFNLNKFKTAQLEQNTEQNPAQPAGSFPVTNEGDFVAKFADRLLAYNNKPGTPQYENARVAAEEILGAVSPGFQEEAKSVIQTIFQLDPSQRDEASNHLLKLYEVLIPESLKSQTMEPVMSQNIEGIVRYSLTDSILNNAKNTEPGIVKTAADQFGQQYLLYGPTEKRICPKLRGKNLSVGDVVSEYTCRHHCIDGIVIDDNKTICGEALWRANSMDKFSREYVDEDGNIVGGYLNKRFEINRNVPEENKMRLKPGEMRKPRPAAWGNTESRLQDMRSKEGEKREYRPETNSGDPFEWCKDVDQNNINVNQAERTRREEASGHKTVQYTNPTKTENNPKTAFNLNKYKTAQNIHNPSPSDTHQPGVNPTAVGIVPVDMKKPQDNKQNDVSPKPMSLEDMNTEKYDFIAGEKRAQEMTDEELRYALRDLQEVIKIQESASREGHSTPKLGFYHDQLHTYAQELNKRKSGKSHAPGKHPADLRADEGAAAQDAWESMEEGRTDDQIMRSLSGKFNLKNFKAAKTCYEGECWDVNPWAVCNKSTGGKNEAGEDTFERCVQKVKSKNIDKPKKKN